MGQLPFEREELKIILKKESETNNSYGKKPEERTIPELLNYGIININKPQGPTSHQVADHIKTILEIKKAGHGGTLDPNVTGVLPVALGESTKAISTLLKAGKEYICVMHLHKEIEEQKIRQTIHEFVGKITQTPPIKSSVKRQPRQRRIYYIEIIEIDRKDVLFKIGCEAGTYIRKICHDIGVRLNTGAHMAELIRTKTAAFKLQETTTLQDLEDAYWYWKNQKKEKYLKQCIMPIERIAEHMKKIWVMDATINPICHGASLKIPGITQLHDKIEKKQQIMIMSLKNELIAIAEAQLASQEITTQQKGIAAKILRVIMPQDLYPIIK